jgi:hypothetical protein
MPESKGAAERRIARDGYDIKSYDDVREQVRQRRQRGQKDGLLIQRLTAFVTELRGRQGDPKDFAMLDQLIMQVAELRERDVGPAPGRLVDTAKELLEAKRAVFFRSASRPSTTGGGATEGMRQRSQREIMTEQSTRRAANPRSFCNPLGATMWISKDSVPSFAKQIGAQDVNGKKERSFILDAQVQSYLGLPIYNALESAKSDPCMRRYFRQPIVRGLVKQNNPRRESMLGHITDRIEAKNTMREYAKIRNERHGAGHCPQLVSGHASAPSKHSGLGFWT